MNNIIQAAVEAAKTLGVNDTSKGQFLKLATDEILDKFSNLEAQKLAQAKAVITGGHIEDGRSKEDLEHDLLKAAADNQEQFVTGYITYKLATWYRDAEAYYE